MYKKTSARGRVKKILMCANIDVLCITCIIKFFEREVLCFEELSFKKNHCTHSTAYIVQNLHFTNTTKKGAPKNTLKNL